MEPKIQRILFSSDLSENARRAFDYLLSIARPCGAEILILHVLDKLAPGTEQRVASAFGPEMYEQLKERKIESARDILIGKKTEYLKTREALNRMIRNSYGTGSAEADAVVDIYIVEGDVADETIAVAREKECDLIVMGSHGPGKLKQAFSEDPVRKLLRRSNIPVLVVPAGTASRGSR